MGNITLSLMVGKPAICCFVAIEKRRIATTPMKYDKRTAKILVATIFELRSINVQIKG